MVTNRKIGDGASYAPTSTNKPVVKPGEFCFAAAYLDHGHIYGQTNGLLEAGGTLCAVYEPAVEKREAFCKYYGDVKCVSRFEELLDDPNLQLIAAAAIPHNRCAIGQQVLQSGKDYFTDKSPFTSLAQLAATKKTCSETGRKYWVYYAERLHNEAAWRAGELIEEGAIGDVLHVANLAPHRLSKETRPSWFFNKDAYGGIITDIGSHQVEQFLTYSGAKSAEVVHARVANLRNSKTPGLEDFGEFNIVASNGASFYARVDWFTPEGSPVWGDGRSFIMGTNGTLEVRKYLDPGRSAPASLILKTDSEKIEVLDCESRVGYPFFGQMILDVLNSSEVAMTQEHIFLAADLSMRAQLMADKNLEYEGMKV